MAAKLEAPKGNGAKPKKPIKKTVKKRKELTADEQLLRAWKRTHENRHRRLDV